MKGNFDTAIAFVLKDEGGYDERDTEGGGAVNMGVTFAVFKAWRITNKKPEPTFADLKAMDVDEAKKIYAAQYAKGIWFDDLPAGVDYVSLDAAVNGGVTGSIKVMQAALGLKPVDGHFGLVTRWAANHRPVGALIENICDQRISDYQKFKRFKQQVEVKRKGEKVLLTNKDGSPKTWGQIWTSRINVVRKRAKAIAGV
jgi:lysozyme family protein